MRMKMRRTGGMSLGRNGRVPEETSEGKRLLSAREMYNLYQETLLGENKKTFQEGGEETFEARTLLPTEMYNFYNMDQYETSPHEEARHKDFDIWLQDFDEQVSKFYIITIMHLIDLSCV